MYFSQFSSRDFGGTIEALKYILSGGAHGRKNIELDSVEVAAAVFGNCDRNISLLENEFSVTAVCRGTQLRLSGEPANVAAASRAVEGMLLLIENHTPLEDQTVRYCISLAHDGAKSGSRN